MGFLDNIISSETRQTIGATTSKIITDVAGSINPALGRLARTGLIPGGFRPNTATPANQIQFLGQQSSNSSQDWKVRISLAEANSIFYQSSDQSGILAPLKATKGVIFPYTPSISVVYNSQYEEQRFTHSNYVHPAYQQSEIQTIQISGEFTAQTRSEADYVLACIYFFRAATKMFFGESGNLTGNPPPIVFLNGYGEHYFPNVPCVITSFTHTMPDSVDYMETKINSSFTGQTYTVKQGDDEIEVSQQRHASTRIPTLSTIAINLRPVYSKSNLAKFNLEQFAAGQLVNRGFI